MREVPDTVVLVTGASGGSGEAIAKTFLAGGAYVIATDVKAPEWETTANERLLRVAMDVTDEAGIKKVFSDVHQFGRIINVLVNNAGVSIASPIHLMSTEIWHKNMDINATGSFFCIREAVKYLLEARRPGRIINIASIAGKNGGFPALAAYSASKAAVIGMTRELALELGGYGITVNAVCPGTVYTPMIQRVIEKTMLTSGLSHDEVLHGMEREIPLGRLQQPQDIADIVVFLASEQAKNINGESINVDGGAIRD